VLDFRESLVGRAKEDRAAVLTFIFLASASSNFYRDLLKRSAPDEPVVEGRSLMTPFQLRELRSASLRVEIEDQNGKPLLVSRGREIEAGGRFSDATFEVDRTGNDWLFLSRPVKGALFGGPG
jgi:hypothetical protein